MIFSEIKPGLSFGGLEINAFRTEKKHERYVFLLGGVHGDEVEGVYALEKLFKWLKTEDTLDIPIIVVPILNMDGYRAGTRVNSRGVDLNRNFPTDDWSPDYTETKYCPGEQPLSEPENKFLVKLMEKYSPGLIISFHTWKPILNFNGDCKDVADFFSRFNSYPVQSDIGYPTPGSFGSYAPKNYQSPVLTFEFPKISEDRLLKDIWHENEHAFKSFFASDLLKEKLSLN